MNKSDLVDIRGFLPEDKNFIMATWLRGLYYGESIFSEMRKQEFMKNYNPIVSGVVENNKELIKIACLKEDPSVILGYAVMSAQALHFVFVKKRWRGIGIAKDLVPESLKQVTHLTKVGLSIVKKKGLDFNPFAVL